MPQTTDLNQFSGDEILARISALRLVNNSDFDTEEQARRKLNAHGIDDAEIARQLSTLKSHTAGGAAVLTSYSLLHSLQHLDALLERSPRLGHQSEATITIFRCVEIALGCLGSLATRMADNLEHENTNRFVANARWRAALHELLYRLSGLIIEVAPDARDGVWLDIRLSPLWRRYEQCTDTLRDGLMTRWSEPTSDIFAEGLDHPGRYVFFNEFVNVSDERTWLSRLSRVRVQGVSKQEGESDTALYARVVGSDEIEAMLGALETTEETDLLPFRIVHQVSEVIANTVHHHLSDVIEVLLRHDGSLSEAARVFELANRLLSGIDDSTKIMMRSLTPNAYRAVRPNLGMVQGTSSVMLRKVLFNTTYPLLVRAFKLRLCDGQPEMAGDDEMVHARALDVLRGSSEPERQLSSILRGLLALHQHVRTWRDNHLQLPKTHLGISVAHAHPTVSLSGSSGAVGIAHQLRQTHASDAVTPLYRAAMGTEPPATHPMMIEGGFDQHMANRTASAVSEAYEVVQNRFLERKRRLSAPPAEEP